MSTQSRLRISLLFAAVGAAAACGVEPPIGEVEQDLGSTYKASIKRGTLTITGTDASSKLTLRLGADGRLEVDVGDDGSADFSFDRSTFSAIVIDAGGGDDVVRMDESNGAFTNEKQVTIIGGAGDDTLIGGVGAETFYGGTGNDTIDGGGGNDVIYLGAGDDTVIWRPGSGSDVIDGEGGSDRLVFNGAAIGEHIELSAVDGRLRLTRDIAAVTLDVAGVENVELHTLRGADNVVVGDLFGTAVTRVDVDLGALPGDPAGDGVGDVVTVNGTTGDTIDVAADGAALVATGVGAQVRVTNGEPALDRLVANAGTVNV